MEQNLAPTNEELKGVYEHAATQMIALDDGTETKDMV